MLEQFLSDIVGQRLTAALSQFRLAPQMKPHALVGDKKRLEKLDTKAIVDLTKQVDLCENTARIELDIDKSKLSYLNRNQQAGFRAFMY